MAKKIDTWEFTKDRVTVKVPVHLVPAGEYHKHKLAKRSHFAVEIPAYNITETDQNLDTLKRRVFKRLSAKIGLEWKPFLHIAVNGSSGQFPEAQKGNRYNEGRGISLEVFTKPVWLTTSATGEKLSKEPTEGVQRFGRRSELDCFIKSGWPETGREKKSYNDSATIYALVPDTPENRAALNLLAKDCDRLIERLMELFMPASAQLTLTNALTKSLLLKP